MSATRHSIVSSTAKFLFLLDYLPSTQGNFTFLQYSADRPWPFPIRPAPAAPSVAILWYFILSYGRQVDYEHRIRVLIVW